MMTMMMMVMMMMMTMVMLIMITMIIHHIAQQSINKRVAGSINLSQLPNPREMIHRPGGRKKKDHRRHPRTPSVLLTKEKYPNAPSP